MKRATKRQLEQRVVRVVDDDEHWARAAEKMKTSRNFTKEFADYKAALARRKK